MKRERFLFIALLIGIVCLLVSCGSTNKALVTTIEAYEYPGLVGKDYSAVGIVKILPLEAPRFGTINDPINYRLMEEAAKIGADDIINVRIDWVDPNNWIAATAVAIKYGDAVLIMRK